MLNKTGLWSHKLTEEEVEQLIDSILGPQEVNDKMPSATSKYAEQNRASMEVNAFKPFATNDGRIMDARVVKMTESHRIWCGPAQIGKLSVQIRFYDFQHGYVEKANAATLQERQTFLLAPFQPADYRETTVATIIALNLWLDRDPFTRIEYAEKKFRPRLFDYLDPTPAAPVQIPVAPSAEVELKDNGSHSSEAVILQDAPVPEAPEPAAPIDDGVPVAPAVVSEEELALAQRRGSEPVVHAKQVMIGGRSVWIKDGKIQDHDES